MKELENNLKEEIDLVPQEEYDMNLQPELGRWASWRQKRRLKSIARKEARSLAKQNEVERKQNGQVTKNMIVGDYALSVIQGVITIGAITIAATTPFVTISLLAVALTIVSGTIFVADVMDAVTKHKEYRKDNPKQKKVKEKKPKKFKGIKKLELFKGLTSEITNKFRKFKTNKMTSNDVALENTDIKSQKIMSDKAEEVIDIVPKEVIEDEPILKTRLTREQKIGQVRDLGAFHSSKLGIYCIPVPKDNKKLQKFIRDEYKKEYPNEEIQSIRKDENKILVLTKDPYMFRK